MRLPKTGSDIDAITIAQPGLKRVDTTTQGSNAGATFRAQRLGLTSIGLQCPANEFGNRDAPAFGHCLGGLLFPLGKSHLQPLVALKHGPPLVSGVHGGLAPCLAVVRMDNMAGSPISE